MNRALHLATEFALGCPVFLPNVADVHILPVHEIPMLDVVPVAEYELGAKERQPYLAIVNGVDDFPCEESEVNQCCDG